MATLLWTACQKEMVPAPGVSSATQVDLTPRIADFVAKAEHQASAQGDPRSTNEFNADSAAWYVEGALNYSLAQAWLPYNELVNDSITIAIASTDGSVTETDAANAYISLLGQLEQTITGEQHLVVADAEPQTTSAGLELKVRYALGQGNERLGLNSTYPSYTSLKWMTQSGNNSCDPNHYSAMGADKTIQGRVAATIPLLAVGQYYASVETWTVAPYGGYQITDFPNSSNTSGHSNQDNLIYSWEGGTGSYCLDANDMTFHTQGTYNVMLLIKAAECPTKQQASVAVWGGVSGSWESYYFHDVTYTYGKPQYRKN